MDQQAQRWLAFLAIVFYTALGSISEGNIFSFGAYGTWLVACGILWSLNTTKSDFPASTRVTTEEASFPKNRVFWITLLMLGVVMLFIHSVVSGFVGLIIIVVTRFIWVPVLICRNLMEMRYYRLIELYNLSQAGDEDAYFDFVRDALWYSPENDTTNSARFNLNEYIVNALYDPSWFGWCLRKRVFLGHYNKDLSLASVAERCEIEGLHGEAEAMLKRALNNAMRKKEAYVEQIFNQLVELHIQREKYTEAETLLNSQVYTSMPTSHDVPTVSSISRLRLHAAVYAGQKNYEQVESCYKQSLTIVQRLDCANKKFSDEPSPLFNAQLLQIRILKVLADFANLYEQQNNQDKAKDVLQEVLLFAKKWRLRSWTITYLNRLANLFRRQKQYSQAESALNEAITILNEAIAIAKQESKGGHVTLTTSLNNLAALFLEQGKYGKAEINAKRALEYSEVSLRDGTDLLVYKLGRLNFLASLYVDQRRYVEAEPLLRQSLAIAEKVAGLSHPIFAKALDNLATVYTEQGSSIESQILHKKAQTIWEGSFAISKRVLGRKHPSVQLIESLSRKTTLKPASVNGARQGDAALTADLN